MSTTTTPVRRPRHERPRLVDEQGIRFGIAEGALVLAVLTAAALHLPLPAALVLVGLAAFGGGYCTSLGWALLLGVSAWAWFTGFLENQLGQLTLASQDLDRLVALALLAVAGSVTWRRAVGRE
jgi:hypothetical protein